MKKSRLFILCEAVTETKCFSDENIGTLYEVVLKALADYANSHYTKTHGVESVNSKYLDLQDCAMDIVEEILEKAILDYEPGQLARWIRCVINSRNIDFQRKHKKTSRCGFTAKDFEHISLCSVERMMQDEEKYIDPAFLVSGGVDEVSEGSLLAEVVSQAFEEMAFERVFIILCGLSGRQTPRSILPVVQTRPIAKEAMEMVLFEAKECVNDAALLEVLDSITIPDSVTLSGLDNTKKISACLCKVRGDMLKELGAGAA